MYRIAICDDEIKTCSDLEEMLYQYGKRNSLTFTIDIWYSGERLCNYLEKGNTIDLLFLDIELVTTDGIAIGKYIREELENRECTIVYISSKTSYAMSLFRIQPLDFLIKPLDMTVIEDIMSRYIAESERKNQLFECYYKGCSYKIPYKKILYFYSDNKKINIVSCDKEIQFNGKLKELAKHVPHNFVLIHQSYLINLDYTRACQYETVTLQNGTILNISQPYRKAVREQLMQYKWKN